MDRERHTHARGYTYDGLRFFLRTAVFNLMVFVFLSIIWELFWPNSIVMYLQSGRHKVGAMCQCSLLSLRMCAGRTPSCVGYLLLAGSRSGRRHRAYSIRQTQYAPAHKQSEQPQYAPAQTKRATSGVHSRVRWSLLPAWCKLDHRRFHLSVTQRTRACARYSRTAHTIQRKQIKLASMPVDWGFYYRKNAKLTEGRNSGVRGTCYTTCISNCL